MNGARQVKALRDYADCTSTDEFAKGLAELREPADHQRPAIMCGEAVPWRCHRRLITDVLIVCGVEVVHIMSGTSAKPAVLSPHARVDNGSLACPPPR